MSEFATPPTLKQLLHNCSHRDSPYWERAWREFLRRYKKVIYKSVTRCCSTWKAPRLQKQFSEVVNDIVNEVLSYLCQNKYGVLSNFRQYECEQKFEAYLSFICGRLTNYHIQSFYVNAIVEGDIDDFSDLIGELDPDMHWELYDAVIEKLRAIVIRKRINLERDIHIFMLYAWSDFSPAMIAALPAFNQMSPRVIQNIIERMRNFLKKIYSS